MEESLIDAMSRRRARREDLIAQVANGLAPEEAERISVSEGHGSLLNNPTYSDIDGFAEPRWTLLMAFAWVAWERNPDHVRLYFPNYRAQCREWVKAGNGHVILPLKQYNAHGAIQSLRADWHDDIGNVFGTNGAKARLAWDNLRAKFHADLIGTFGQLVNETARGVIPIPSINWQGLQLMPPTGRLVDSLCYADEVPVYLNVTVDRDQLLAAFPASEAPTGAAQAKARQSGPAPMDDDTYMDRMKELLDAAAAGERKLSVNSAAAQAASERPGHSKTATQKRIHRAFSRKYPERMRAYGRG